MKKAIILLVGLTLLAGGPAAAVQAASTDEDVTKIEDVTRGAHVTLQGKVTRILDEDEFRLADETGSILIYIGWRNRVMVRVGETVTVKGIVDDDLVSAFRPEVYASELRREDGTRIRLN
ncbi:MAG: NirD/YgiW/YdeI family stress tolerance protein [Desulfobacterales bacterium]|nr:NirD/YgiW/YdeI family stress tolerance protein [Desulfobacterales bacterium]